MKLRYFTQGQMFEQEVWQAFTNRGLHLNCLNIISLLLKIDELGDIAKRKKDAVSGISESNPDNKILDPH